MKSLASPDVDQLTKLLFVSPGIDSKAENLGFFSSRWVKFNPMGLITGWPDLLWPSAEALIFCVDALILLSDFSTVKFRFLSFFRTTSETLDGARALGVIFAIRG